MSDRTVIWESLLRHAFDIIDAASALSGLDIEVSLGGGTMLMRRYRHRVSKDLDFFVSDAQFLGFVSPRLNTTVESMTSEYVEQAGFVKLYFETGEVDFVVATPLTESPTKGELILGREIEVETDAEIIAKKVEYRAKQLKARDVFDLSCVIEKNPNGLDGARSAIVSGRPHILERLAKHREVLEEDFAAIDTLDYTPSYQQCVDTIQEYLGKLR